MRRLVVNGDCEVLGSIDIESKSDVCIPYSDGIHPGWSQYKLENRKCTIGGKVERVWYCDDVPLSLISRISTFMPLPEPTDAIN